MFTLALSCQHYKYDAVEYIVSSWQSLGLQQMHRHTMIPVYDSFQRECKNHLMSVHKVSCSIANFTPQPSLVILYIITIISNTRTPPASGKALWINILMFSLGVCLFVDSHELVNYNYVLLITTFKMGTLTVCFGNTRRMMVVSFKIGG